MKSVIAAEKGVTGGKEVFLFPKGSSESVAEFSLPPFPAGERGLRITLKLLADSTAADGADVFSSEVICGEEKINSAFVQSFVNAGD